MNHANYNIHIQKTILSSLIFNASDGDLAKVERIKSFINMLDESDFVLNEHKSVFSAIVKLDNQNMPLDESFILKALSGRYQDELIWLH